MIIKNALIYGTDHDFHARDLLIAGERIAEIHCRDTAKSAGLPAGGISASTEDAESLEAEGMYAIPGLVDIHFHGAAGHDFCDADEAGLQAIADFEASKGVLAICPATMTYSEEILENIMRTAAAHRNGRGADLVGIHMEGPFLSPDRLGAQNPAYVHRPDAGMLGRLQEASGGLIRIVDIAPEVEGAMSFIRAVSGDYVISLAHTCCEYQTAAAAFAAGARHLTHLYNAMPGMHHRMPGPIPAAVEAHAEAELIADGIHVHPAMVRMAFRIFDPDKIILISDSMMATGLPDGQYQLGGQDVTVRGNRAVLTRDPETIAGSVTCLYDCMRTAVREMGIPLEAAVRSVTENPARSIGVDGDYGALKPGCCGNVVLLDRDLRIRAVIQKGRILCRNM